MRNASDAAGFWQSAERADCCLSGITAYRVVNRAVKTTKAPSRGRHSCALTYVLDGCYRYTASDGRVFECRRGDMSFLPYGSRYSHVNMESPSRMYVIYFNLTGPDGARLAEGREIEKLAYGDSAHFERLFAEVINRFFGVIPSPSGVKAALYRLIGALAGAEASMQLSEKELLRIAPALDFLAGGKLSDEVTVSGLARMCSMSEYAFRELFKKYAGMTPKAYIDERRVEQVEALLAGSDMSITDAAIACGFMEPSYFFKLYKRLRGVTPGKRAL